MNKLTYQTPIRIVNDWSKTIQVLEHSVELVTSNSPRITKRYQYSDYGYHYEIGNTGTVSHVTNGSSYWYAVAGPVIESTMRFLPMLREDLAELEPTFATVNILVGDGAEHKDQNNQLTGFNYFITTTNSTTHVRDSETEESYPSVRDTGWILDIQQRHRISNTDRRIWFNMRFGKPFDYCRDWFADQLVMVYE